MYLQYFIFSEFLNILGLKYQHDTKGAEIVYIENILSKLERG